MLEKTVFDENNKKIFHCQYFDNLKGTFTLSAYMNTKDVVSEHGGAYIGVYTWNYDSTEDYIHTDFLTGTSSTEVENG